MSPSLSGQQLASSIPSPPTSTSSSKSWRSKSMNLKHSATSGMLAGPGQDLPPPQRSVLDKFRMMSPRAGSRVSPSVVEMALQEEEDGSECGDEGGGLAITGTTPAKTLSSTSNGKPSSLSQPKSNSSKSTAPPKDKEDKSKSSRASKDQTSAETSKKNPKLASFIPKGGKSSSAKKDTSSSPSPPPSSGIPKPGSKTGSKSQTQALNSSGNLRSGDKPSKGSVYRSGGEGKRSSLTSSTSTSALMTGGGGSCGLGGSGAVQLPQQQQHSHPNTATVAPFMYRTFSENDCTMVAPADSSLSPTKGDLIYSKTAKQCLEEISGRTHSDCVSAAGVGSWAGVVVLSLSPVSG
ncbi:unnamed protein product [Knipowitschia caucasica]|uniref:Neuron navigator 3 n=1 Tax=Knipowitschia caucasica TaxID=637954 RepID=A0AAV2IZW4_KNICA